jgi:hypothetical protein
MKRLLVCRGVLMLFGVLGCALALASCDASDVLPQVSTNSVAGAYVNADPHGSYLVVGAPTVTAGFIDKVLAAYGSPASGKGQALYDLGVKYGIDPVFALAMFQHESSFGKAGEARSSLSLGNLRGVPDEMTCRDGFAWFATWEDGFEAFYRLIWFGYVKGQVTGHPCTTVEQIIPIYAPSSDGNTPIAYIRAVEQAMTVWRSGHIYG